MEEGTVVAIISLGVTLFIALVGFLYWRRRRKKAFFDVVWKHASALTPEEAMSYRGRKENGYAPYYYPRRVDEKIKELIRNKKNVIVLGKPLAGKTRSVYEALKSLDEPAVVTIPRMIDINPLEFDIPANIKWWKLEILLVDDVGKFIAKPNFTHVLREFVKRRTVIVATCWLDEWDTVKQKLEQEAGLHFAEPITQEDVTGDEAKDVATQAHKAVPKTFDGNIGSIFFDLDEMRRRFNAATSEEKAILRSVKRLYQAGLYEGREVFDLDKIKAVGSKAEGLSGRQYHWTELVGKLVSKGFLTREKRGLHCEEAYLQQYIIEDDFSVVAEFLLLEDLFTDDPDALLSIGARACDKAQTSLLRAEYERLAIRCYGKVLNKWTIKAIPAAYAQVQNNLGTAYQTLGEVADKASNCGKAIAAYKEALRVYTYDGFPMDYGETQSNLGAAYRKLAELTDQAVNCGNAIAAHNKALRVHTYEDFPIDYGTTQINLGNAYSTLAKIADKASNCGNAISAFKEALRVITYEDFPMDYGMTQNNLGNAYITLAEVTDQALNFGNAMAAYREALRVFTYEEFPFQYGMTQSNLSTAYTTLSGVADKASNCGNALAALKEALRVFTYEDFPIQYGITQNNLGAAFQRLAEVADKASNCGNAIAAYNEALRVRTYGDFPIDYGGTQFNLGSTYWILAEAEDKEGNCLKAREALESAITVFAEQKLPDWHRRASNSLEALAAFCEGEDESDS